MSSLNAVRKSLQKEFTMLSHQTARIGAALAALSGKNGHGTGKVKRTYTMTVAQRKRNIANLKKARAARALKFKKQVSNQK